MNKDTEGRIVIFVLMLIIGFLTTHIYKSITQQEKNFEYAQNGTIGVSSNCWLDNGVGYCEVNNKVIRVQNYYEVE